MSREIRVVETPEEGPAFTGTSLEEIVPEDILTEPLPEWLDNVDMAIVFIDAKTAAEMRARNVEPEIDKGGSNRRGYEALIKQYAADMLADRWQFTHQGVAFDEKGRLVDGNHRLAALELAGKARPDIRVPFLVITGVPVEAMDSIDIGRRRSLSDMLQMKGFPNTLQLSSTARLVYLFRNGQFDRPDRRYWSNARPTRQELAAFVGTDPEGLKAAVRIGGQSKIFTPAAVSAAWYIITNANTGGDHELFFKQLANGEHIGQGDPVFALRRWGINARAKAGAMEASWIQFAMLVKGFQYFRTGRRSHLAIWKAEVEAFPKP